MELYDSTIREIKERISGRAPKTWGYEPARAWADNGQNELVLTRDAAYELGGGNLPRWCLRTQSSLLVRI